ncbi:hypothetical protein JCM8547_002870 [Rhodosporidiobolus lusitaniae]
MKVSSAAFVSLFYTLSFLESATALPARNDVTIAKVGDKPYVEFIDKRALFERQNNGQGVGNGNARNDNNGDIGERRRPGWRNDREHDGEDCNSNGNNGQRGRSGRISTTTTTSNTATTTTRGRSRDHNRPTHSVAFLVEIALSIEVALADEAPKAHEDGSSGFFYHDEQHHDAADEHYDKHRNEHHDVVFSATTTSASTTSADGSAPTSADGSAQATVSNPFPTTSTTTTTTPASAPSSTVGANIRAAALNEHNRFRALHGTQPLVWDRSLADAAGRWASRCVFEHSQGAVGPYGENLAANAGSTTTPVNNNVVGLIQLWEDEASEYNPSNPVYSHFTQMVWKSTTTLGCVLQTCAPGTIFDANYGSSAYLVCGRQAQSNEQKRDRAATAEPFSPPYRSSLSSLTLRLDSPFDRSSPRSTRAPPPPLAAIMKVLSASIFTSLLYTLSFLDSASALPAANDVTISKVGDKPSVEIIDKRALHERQVEEPRTRPNWRDRVVTTTTTQRTRQPWRPSSSVSFFPAPVPTTTTTTTTRATTTTTRPSVPATSAPTSADGSAQATVSNPFPTTSTTTTTTPASAPSSTVGANIRAAALNEHNRFRALHGAQPLVWDQGLADAAGRWASRCVFQHSQGAVGNYGENLAANAGSSSLPVDQNTVGLITLWEDEAPEYDPSNPVYSHFTQMVWKSTTKLGCVLQTCAPGTIFDANYGASAYLVCENFRANVQP